MRDIVHAATIDDGTRVEGVGMPLTVMQALQRLVPCDRLDAYGLDWKVLGHYLGDSLDGPEAEIDRAGCCEPQAYDGWDRATRSGAPSGRKGAAPGAER